MKGRPTVHVGPATKCGGRASPARATQEQGGASALQVAALTGRGSYSRRRATTNSSSDRASSQRHREEKERKWRLGLGEACGPHVLFPEKHGPPSDWNGWPRSIDQLLGCRAAARPRWRWATFARGWAGPGKPPATGLPAAGPRQATYGPLERARELGGHGPISWLGREAQ